MDYSSFISQITKELNVSENQIFKKANKKDMQYLKSSKYPDCILDFYSQYEPQDCVEINGVRLWPINYLKAENKDGVSIYPIYALGFRAIASTKYGDVYCLNINQKMNGGQPFIYISSHEDNAEDLEDEIAKGEIDEEGLAVEKTADSFEEFLEKFIGKKLPDNYYDAVNSFESTKITKSGPIIIPHRIPTPEGYDASGIFYKMWRDWKYKDALYNPKKEHFDVEDCPVFSVHRTAPKKKDENLSIVIKGKRMGDFVFTVFSDLLITDKTAQIFEKHRLTGYKLREVDVANKELPFKLWQVIAVGKVKLHPDMDIKEVYRCEHCNFVRSFVFNDDVGIKIAENSWDGSDFFEIGRGYHIFVSEKVKKIIDEHKLKGAQLIPGADFRFNEFIYPSDRNQTAEQWKEFYETNPME
jgi:hypothetical protein